MAKLVGEYLAIGAWSSVEVGVDGAYYANYAVISRFDDGGTRKVVEEGRLDGVFKDMFTAQYNGMLEAIGRARELQGDYDLKPLPYSYDDALP